MNIMKGFEVKQASVLDSAELISMLKDIAQWMRDHKINQWSYLLEGGDDEEIMQAIKDRYTYIISEENKIIATFTLSPEQNEWDKHIFGQDVQNDSLYLHRLAVSTKYMNRGMGKNILKWIEEDCQGDKKYIKLDCVADNHKLNQFYRDNGFDYIGETDNHSKYQKAFRQYDEMVKVSVNQNDMEENSHD